jgi:hypothetical protein
LVLFFKGAFYAGDGSTSRLRPAGSSFGSDTAWEIVLVARSEIGTLSKAG